MTFEEKVRSMTAKEILGAMIAGLQREWVKIDMTTFGFTDQSNTVCFGCAATNTICQIQGDVIPATHIKNTKGRSEFINAGLIFTDIFEQAINYLRKGRIEMYNYCAKIMGAPKFSDWPLLPPLTNENWRDNLQCYIDWFNSMP